MFPKNKTKGHNKGSLVQTGKTTEKMLAPEDTLPITCEEQTVIEEILFPRSSTQAQFGLHQKYPIFQRLTKRADDRIKTGLDNTARQFEAKLENKRSK